MINHNITYVFYVFFGRARIMLNGKINVNLGWNEVTSQKFQQSVLINF